MPDRGAFNTYYIMLLSMFSPYKQHQILCNEANTSVNWWFFYCTELKKAGTLNTPSIAFSNKNKLAFSATPCQNKNARKRLGLFSPASSRKGRKYVWTHKLFIFFLTMYYLHVSGYFDLSVWLTLIKSLCTSEINIVYRL